MSWTDELYNIYERFCGTEADGAPLLPVSHSTANAQLELTIDESGSFCGAVRVSKEDAVTIIPVTEGSGARSSGICPHPFADKLVYIAGDYGKYAEGKRSDNSKFFTAYIEQLRDWANSEFCHPAVTALLAYLEKGVLIKDLIADKALVIYEDTGKLKQSEKINGIAQADSMVRIRIQYRDTSRENRTWMDKSLYDSFIAFNSSNMGECGLCYALGDVLPITYKHPNKIRNAGDKAKLISTNDESGFTYRGRFANKEQAASVSYEFSQKVHNALKWLISRQGKAIDSLTILIWESDLNNLPSVYDAVSDDDFEDFGEVEQNTPDDPNKLGAAYKKQLDQSIFGHENTLKPTSKTMVMMLDAATTGRLSMIMYTELETTRFLKNLCAWHEQTAWLRFSPKLKKNVLGSFCMEEIVKCAFGTEQEQNGKTSLVCKPEVRRDTYQRLIPCVTEGRKLPRDIMNTLVNKASNPLAYSQQSYNWQLVIEVACGMIKKVKTDNKEECNMALDKECTDRDYLYGRLLAWADAAESSTYDDEDRNKRVTNARRYFNAFANRPYTTWGVIERNLNPYLNRLTGGSRVYFTKIYNEINDKFARKEFMDNSKLEPEFLLAYSCQLKAIYDGNKNSKSEDNSKED